MMTEDELFEAIKAYYQVDGDRAEDAFMAMKRELGVRDGPCPPTHPNGIGPGVVTPSVKLKVGGLTK